MWSLPATATEFWGQPKLKVSDDGRRALIWFPPDKQDQQIALIRLKDGFVIEKFSFGKSGGDVGFAAGGKELWTLTENVFARYKLGDARR